jgi:phosphatidylinositol glycan class V
MLPFVALWALMALYNLFNMHVQVILRFLTSQPALYWYCAHIIMTKGVGHVYSKCLIGYFVLYGMAGVVLFGNFYPPA